MRRILFDTNIILDVLLEREPHVAGSAAAWNAVENGRRRGMLSAHAVTTIRYVIRKETGNAKALRILTSILKVFEVAAIDSPVIHEALQLPISDFEYSVTAAAAHLAGCEFIVTRDPKGFRGSPVRALTPEALVPLL